MYGAQGEVQKKQEILRREWGRGCMEEGEGAWAEGALGTELG